MKITKIYTFDDKFFILPEDKYKKIIDTINSNTDFLVLHTTTIKKTNIKQIAITEADELDLICLLSDDQEYIQNKYKEYMNYMPNHPGALVRLNRYVMKDNTLPGRLDGMKEFLEKKVKNNFIS